MLVIMRVSFWWFRTTAFICIGVAKDVCTDGLLVGKQPLWNVCAIKSCWYRAADLIYPCIAENQPNVELAAFRARYQARKYSDQPFHVMVVINDKMWVVLHEDIE